MTAKYSLVPPGAAAATTVRRCAPAAWPTTDRAARPAAGQTHAGLAPAVAAAAAVALCARRPLARPTHEASRSIMPSLPTIPQPSDRSYATTPPEVDSLTPRPRRSAMQSFRGPDACVVLWRGVLICVCKHRARQCGRTVHQISGRRAVELNLSDDDHHTHAGCKSTHSGRPNRSISIDIRPISMQTIDGSSPNAFGWMERPFNSGVTSSIQRLSQLIAYVCARVFVRRRGTRSRQPPYDVSTTPPPTRLTTPT